MNRMNGRSAFVGSESIQSILDLMSGKVRMSDYAEHTNSMTIKKTWWNEKITIFLLYSKVTRPSIFDCLHILSCGTQAFSFSRKREEQKTEIPHSIWIIELRILLKYGMFYTVNSLLYTPCHGILVQFSADTYWQLFRCED